MTRTQAAAALALTIAASASADEPIAGWDRARWGMSSSDIKSAYPAATSPHKRDISDHSGRGELHCALELSDIRVGGCDFTVRFLMDSADRLAAVQLFKDFGKNRSDGHIAYLNVKELLIQKHGTPTTDKEEKSSVPHVPSADASSERSVWYGPNAKITFGYVSTPLIGLFWVVLTYAKPGDTERL